MSVIKNNKYYKKFVITYSKHCSFKYTYYLFYNRKTIKIYIYIYKDKQNIELGMISDTNYYQ